MPGLRLKGRLFSETDSKVTADSGDTGDSLVSFICSISISGSGDAGESVLCLIWISSWHLNLFGEGFEGISLNISVVDF